MSEGAKVKKVADGIAYIRTLIANVCFVGEPGKKGVPWVLVDTGMPGTTEIIIKAAEELFGQNNPTKTIILTHGHFDHVGAVIELSNKWNIDVYAHELEMPYLTGKSSYSSPDPSVSNGLMAKASVLYPRGPIDLGDRINVIPSDGSIPSMPGWRWIHTPGHTPGHISLFREADRVLIAGDAFTTVKQESAIAVMTQHKELNGPPAYFTTNWMAAWDSVKKLEALNPAITITGHGEPMCCEELTKQLNLLAADFDQCAIPDHGKYVNHPEPIGKR